MVAVQPGVGDADPARDRAAPVGRRDAARARGSAAAGLRGWRRDHWIGAPVHVLADHRHRLHPDMVTRAAQRLAFFGERVRVERADATGLQYADETFDLVVAVHVWHHVGDWRTATAEAHRVLRPDCALLLADFVAPVGMARKWPRLLPSGTYTLPELRGVLSACGFTLDFRTGRSKLWYCVLARR